MRRRNRTFLFITITLALAFTAALPAAEAALSSIYDMPVQGAPAPKPKAEVKAPAPKAQEQKATPAKKADDTGNTVEMITFKNDVGTVTMEEPRYFPDDVAKSLAKKHVDFTKKYYDADMAVRAYIATVYDSKYGKSPKELTDKQYEAMRKVCIKKITRAGESAKVYGKALKEAGASMQGLNPDERKFFGRLADYILGTPAYAEEEKSKGYFDRFTDWASDKASDALGSISRGVTNVKNTIIEGTGATLYFAGDIIGADSIKKHGDKLLDKAATNRMADTIHESNIKMQAYSNLVKKAPEGKRKEAAREMMQSVMNGLETTAGALARSGSIYRTSEVLTQGVAAGAAITAFVATPIVAASAATNVTALGAFPLMFGTATGTVAAGVGAAHQSLTFIDVYNDENEFEDAVNDLKDIEAKAKLVTFGFDPSLGPSKDLKFIWQAGEVLTKPFDLASTVDSVLNSYGVYDKKSDGAKEVIEANKKAKEEEAPKKPTAPQAPSFDPYGGGGDGGGGG